MNQPVNENNLCQKIEKDERRRFNREENVKPFSGFIIIRLSEKHSFFDSDKLQELAEKHQLTRLLSILETHKPQNIRSSVKSVSVEKLRELEENAERSEFPPLHSLSSYWRLDYRNYDGNLDELVERFQELHEVDLAYKEMSASDPTIDPSDDTFVAQQLYLNRAPRGIDARWAWTQLNCQGVGVGFIDLEQGWIPTHEDLAAASPTLVFNDNRHGYGTYIGNHGTSVLGVVVGVDNNRGVVGIAPRVDYVRMVSHYKVANDGKHVADAIVAAIKHMNAGDVLLLEVARDELPTETDAVDFDAIRLAVANGIIVVEAAGNGNGIDTPRNLDKWTDMGKFRLNRGHNDFRDSGAIMVSAATSACPHNRMRWANFGSRIDCYAYGENIVTTGKGDLAGSTTGTRNDDYTKTFGGTSGASPIVVGAALIIQGKYKAVTKSVLSSLQMRALLSHPANGTPQGGGVAGNIGVMPDLRVIIETSLILVPDVYLRDFAGDTGQVPTTGAISTSPDIIVRPTQAANPTAEFGEGSGNENSATLGSTVKPGQDNFIYVRMKNRGGSAANDVKADIYWSEVSTLVTPNLWNFIGTTAPVNVPVGDTLVVAPALTWGAASLPPDTHQSFIGILRHAQDDGPPVPSAYNFDLDDFIALIRNHNNVTWKNFNVVDDVDPSDPNATLPFNIVGAPDEARKFDFEIIRALPEEASLWLEMPFNLFAFTRIKGIETNIDRKGNKVSVLLPPLRRFGICDLNLPKSARYKCRFVVKGGKGYENGLHQIAIRQVYENFEVGRVTWGLKVKTEN
jgi:subtilisin family serine protease